MESFHGFLNGYIWVSKHANQNEQEGEEGFDAEAVYSNRNDVSEPELILVVRFSHEVVR